MRTIVKLKWVVLVLWLVATAVLLFTAPPMSELVRTKGQITLPDHVSSQEAARLEQQLKGETGDDLSAVLVLHEEKGLTAAQHEQAKGRLQDLLKNHEAGVTAVTTHYQMAELADQMASKDGSTVLVMLTIDQGERTYSEVRDDLYEALEEVGAPHYLTSEWLIVEDVIESSQEGLKKTEYITIVFILIILFAVFRSAAAPIVPLLTVGFTYLVSQSVVAFLVKYADFPLSNFSQMFLVAVLFGIGTDYCILLISRFKEELVNKGDKVEAIIETYRTAGKTVLFAGLAVLVGFSAIGLSTFSLYQSAVAVAVGIAILLLALVTLVPFFMAAFGKALFWPTKGSLSHKQSKIWGTVGAFSLKRPVWSIIILAVIIVPLLLSRSGEVSYNSLDEIGDKYRSVKAFDVISEKFGPGESMPAAVLISAEQPLDSSEGLAALELVSRELAKSEGVKAVRSATRPTGEQIDDFLVTDQLAKLQDGLVQGADGIDQISDGLSKAHSGLADNAPKIQLAVDSVGELAAGTKELQAGTSQLREALVKLAQGVRSGSTGAAELQAGVAEAASGARELAAASKKLLDGYEQATAGLGQIAGGYDELTAQQAQIAQGLAGTTQGLEQLAQRYPDLQQDTDYLQAIGTLQQLQAGAAGIEGGLSTLGTQLKGVQQGLQGANAGLAQAQQGQVGLASGLDEIATGLTQLQAGLRQAASGQEQVSSQMPQVEQGLEQLASGQLQLQEGFGDLGKQLEELTSGLSQSVDGLEQVSSGLTTANGYLAQLSSNADAQLGGWYIPEEAQGNDQFKQMLDTYMSEDRLIARMDVVFAGNPYHVDSMNQINGLQQAAERALVGTPFEKATVAIGGVTSINHDMSDISAQDYSRTVTFMLIGIAIVLLLMFRSLVMPIYIIGSLLITFFASLSIAELIFVRGLGLSGLGSAVPFFGFVMLIALGVDYSIFLMDRFKEYRHLSPAEGILEAMKNMGTVIMSAAVILGGTFAAMLPSGVMSMMQIAVVLLCGLFLYALIMLPLFIPVVIRIFGEANWWPFMKRS